MAAGSTYTPIATTTLGSNTATVTFSSISGYTDIRAVLSAKLVTGSQSGMMRFNSDSGTNYSFTYLVNTASGRATGTTFALAGGFTNTEFAPAIVDIMNYANTTTYKTVLDRRGYASSYTGADVSLWRNTAAITSISFIPENGDNWITGSTFTLYGIASA